jgi:hypothetical protein
LLNVARKAEDLITRVRRHLDPAIDPTDRQDQRHWIWRGAKNSNGYPVLGSRPASRQLYELWLGEALDKGVWLRSTCGDQECINPNHFRLQGTRYHPDFPETCPVPTVGNNPGEVLKDDIGELLRSIKGWWDKTPEQLFDEMAGEFSVEAIKVQLRMG